MRVLVVGAAGQLGVTAARACRVDHDVTTLTRADVDVTDHRALERAIDRARPEVVLNCAAYNDVDRAEDDPAAAFAVNAWAVRALARCAAERDATLVHYSTDFVFDGDAPGPYGEDTAPNPRSTYAVSKLIGEWFAEDCPRHYVLRVESLFGSAQAHSSIDRMYADIVAGRAVRAFADRTVSPSHVEHVVRATLALVTTRPPFGIYHCVNTGETTWLGIANELATLAGRSGAPITPTMMRDAKLRAPRPLHAALSNAKLRAAGILMPTWQEALGEYIKGV